VDVHPWIESTASSSDRHGERLSPWLVDPIGLSTIIRARADRREHSFGLNIHGLDDLAPVVDLTSRMAPIARLPHACAKSAVDRSQNAD
jgi:hypothetical protein